MCQLGLIAGRRRHPAGASSSCAGRRASARPTRPSCRSTASRRSASSTPVSCAVRSSVSASCASTTAPDVAHSWSCHPSPRGRRPARSAAKATALGMAERAGVRSPKIRAYPALRGPMTASGRPNVFSGPYIDRISISRRDPAALAAALTDPSSRIVLVWRSRNLVRQTPAPQASLLLLESFRQVLPDQGRPDPARPLQRPRDLRRGAGGRSAAAAVRRRRVRGPAPGRRPAGVRGSRLAGLCQGDDQLAQPAPLLWPLRRADPRRPRRPRHVLHRRGLRPAGLSAPRPGGHRAGHGRRARASRPPGDLARGPLLHDRGFRRARREPGGHGPA